MTCDIRSSLSQRKRALDDQFDTSKDTGSKPNHWEFLQVLDSEQNITAAFFRLARMGESDLCARVK